MSFKWGPFLSMYSLRLAAKLWNGWLNIRSVIIRITCLMASFFSLVYEVCFRTLSLRWPQRRKWQTLRSGVGQVKQCRRVGRWHGPQTSPSINVSHYLLCEQFLHLAGTKCFSSQDVYLPTWRYGLAYPLTRRATNSLFVARGRVWMLRPLLYIRNIRMWGPFLL
jgi:hypothetical protein